jgi:hypothetical protein
MLLAISAMLSQLACLGVEWNSNWYALYMAGVSGPGTGPQYYAVGGLVSVLTPNLALDIRVGGDLTKAADHVVTGVGFALR